MRPDRADTQTRKSGALVLLVGGMLLTLGLSMAGPAAADDDLDAISAAVFDYFEGINQASRERLERAFDASAELKSVGKSGEIVAVPIANAISRWAQSEPLARTGKILSIDVTEGEIARVVFDFDGAYTDFLTLAKLNGRWKIIDKVFVAH